MSLGDNIKNIRKNIKMKQSELAEKLDVTTRTIQNYESGNREPNIETLKKIAGILDVPIITILGPVDDENLRNKLLTEVDSDELFASKSDREDIKEYDEVYNLVNQILKTKYMRKRIVCDLDKILSYDDINCEICDFVINMLRMKISDLSLYE